MTSLQAFHIAIPVHDFDAARSFYGKVLGCMERRSGRRWLEYDLMGHQLVAHLEPDMSLVRLHAPIDERHLPVPHFGVVLTMLQWHELVKRIRQAGVSFALEPAIHCEGQPDEQGTFFILDPSGNALEFKAFADTSYLFGK